MERRAFLSLLGRAAAAAGLSAYVPDFPLPQVVVEQLQVLEPALTLDEINALCVRHVTPEVVDAYFKPSPLFLLLDREMSA